MNKKISGPKDKKGRKHWSFVQKPDRHKVTLGSPQRRTAQKIIAEEEK